MRFNHLDQWLHWQETLNPKKIDLTLERVQQVLSAMQLLPPPFTVITVAGTNGKGSCVAMLSSILKAGGYRVGSFTSPHIHRYNERIAVNGDSADDATIMASFDAIDQARGDIPLTYFEFSTLAALAVFASAKVDIAVLEVGLGGRLDATNAVDADAALVASIGIDHVSWLGDNREAIGFEKAGIFRSNKPAICGDPDPPTSVRRVAEELNARWQTINEDFGYRRETNGWSWWAGEKRRNSLPIPALRGEVQLQNAATVIMTLESLSEHFPLSQADIRQGLQEVSLPARFQILPGEVTKIFDVAHNAAAAQELAKRLTTLPKQGRTYAVFSALADKDIAGIVKPLTDLVDQWSIFQIDTERAATIDQLSSALLAAGAVQFSSFGSPKQAWQATVEQATAGDYLLVFGSFYAVADIMNMEQLDAI